MGSHQSPVDLSETYATPQQLPPLVLENFDKEIHGVGIENNGHTLHVHAHRALRERRVSGILLKIIKHSRIKKKVLPFVRCWIDRNI